MSPIGKKLFRFVEFDDEEQLIAEIRKHPIGAIAVIIIGVTISLALVIALSVLAFNLDRFGFEMAEGAGTGIKMLIIGGAFLLGLLALAVTAISLVLYRLNVVFITSEKIAEVRYVSLFNRQVTQLNIGKVEDITVTQRGIFAHLFDYGTMLIETAGEKTNPAFTMVPNPNLRSQQIIEAHERYVEKYGN